MRILIGMSLVASCLVVAGFQLAGDKGEGKSTEYVISLPSFDVTSIKESDKVANHSVEVHYKVTRDLLDQLRKSKTNAGKTYCIYLLGTFRAQRAAGDLVKMIDFEAERMDPKTRKARWGQYPASGALIKIGGWSVQPILRALGTEKNETRRRLMLYVLVDVLQKDVAKFVLDGASKAATDEQKPQYEKASDKLAEMMRMWK